MAAKFPKPFFRSGRGWYVQLGAKQVKLAPGPENAETERAALARYHEVMAAKPQATPPRPAGGMTVAEVFDLFLDWCQKHRAARTYEWYRDHLQNFLDVSDTGRLPAAELKPFHVIEWADSHGDSWSPAYRKGAVIAAQRPFNWAVKVGHLAASPIPHVEKPRAQRRETCASPGDWERIKAAYPVGDCFVEMLEFCWETGCRPQEAKKLEARHVHPERLRAVFPPEESKGKRRARVVHFTARALELILPKLAARPKGPLFVNADGNPWTAHAMACRFGRLKKHVGVKFSAYDLRHGFATRKLVEGHDHLTVAELLGHANGRMLAETYQHLGGEDGHLRKALGD